MEWLNLVFALALVGGSWYATVRLLEWSAAPRPRTVAYRKRFTANRPARHVHLLGTRAEHRAR